MHCTYCGYHKDASDIQKPGIPVCTGCADKLSDQIDAGAIVFVPELKGERNLTAIAIAFHRNQLFLRDTNTPVPKHKGPPKLVLESSEEERGDEESDESSPEVDKDSDVEEGEYAADLPEDYIEEDEDELEKEEEPDNASVHESRDII